MDYPINTVHRRLRRPIKKPEMFLGRVYGPLRPCLEALQTLQKRSLNAEHFGHRRSSSKASFISRSRETSRVTFTSSERTVDS